MRTSEEIYHRVRWDSRFDASRFTLGILARGAPPKRLPLTSFEPGGDIPWHRVLFVEADGEVVWDRASGVDRLGETSAGRARSDDLLPPPFFRARPVRGDATAEPGARLRVLTWNTLWDRYDRELIDTARRRPLLLAELARADADVIALQEVEPALYEMLALAGYAISDGADVESHGLVLLSRLPVLAAGHHAMSAHKGVAAMVVRTAAGPVAVLATHLTSDHHRFGPGRRIDELSQLTVGLAVLECPVVVLGDFNGGPVERLELVDAWTAVRGDETPTFDPTVNPLAAVSSLTGRAARLDRVLVRGVRPVAAALLGTGPDFVSDHYGVAVELEVSPARGGGEFEAAEPETDDTSEAAVADVVQRVGEALPDGVVHVVGSRRMGCAAPGADLDLVVVLPREVRVQVPGAERVRPVIGARVPGLRFRLDGLAVDLTVVAGNPPGADIALSAVTDADAVLAAVDGRHHAFAELAKAVKTWAAARGLDSAPHGGLPGIAWTVLAARTAREGGGLADFFGQWAAWDWRKPVTLLGDHVPATGDAMTIMTPSAPVRSCTEQVTAGMRDLVTAELYAAWAGEPAPPGRHAAWARLVAEPVPGEDFDVTLGRLRGKVRALLALLPADAHAWPTAVERTATVARYAVGLGATPPTAAELAAVAERWRLPGVRVEWAATLRP